MQVEMGGELRNVPAYLQFIPLFLVLNPHNHNSHCMFIRLWSPLKQPRQRELLWGWSEG